MAKRILRRSIRRTGNGKVTWTIKCGCGRKHRLRKGQAIRCACGNIYRY